MNLSIFKRGLCLGLFCLLHHFGIAQATCDKEVTNKKAKKFLVQSQNHKSEDRERIEAAKEAVRIDPECMPCRMQLARLLFLRAKYGNISYNPAGEQYQAIIDQCPEFHSDPYYYLGVIAFAQDRTSDAISFFNAFVDFDSEDTDAFSKGYDKKIMDIEDIMPELEFFSVFKKDSVKFEPVKVEKVSTKFDEYLPAITADNQQLIYTRRSNKQKKGDLFAKMVEELVISFWDENIDDFGEGKTLTDPFNMGDNYGGLALSGNGREIYITICKEDLEGYNNCDIYVSHYHRYLDEEDDTYKYKWSDIKPLPKTINRGNTWEAQPSISADGQELYFASFREQDNMMDLYLSLKDSEGNWAEAQPIKELNSTGNDKAPFIHPDGKTLFFASDNQLGAGGYDLYMSRKKNDGGWTKPKNLGIPINTHDDEHGLVVSTSGDYAYFSSSRIDGSLGLDIYKFILPIPVRPKKMAVIKGKITGLWYMEHDSAKVELKNLENNTYVEANIDSSDGEFFAVVAAEDAADMVLTVKKEGFAFESKLLTENQIKTGSTIITNLSLKKLQKGETYTIHDINYETNSAEIAFGSKLVLQEFALYLQENPQLTINIFGHTDNVGTPKSNLILSDKRANAVRDYLISLGITANRLTAKGLGETQPLQSNELSEGKASNRRTEFQIVTN